jgi:3-oxoacyl-[acyl-carrier protein] reductase
MTTLENTSLPVALITGATGGLGRYLVRAYWQSGCHVFATGRDAHALEHINEELGKLPNSHNQRFEYHTIDLRCDGSAADLAVACLAAFGRIDHLICNAAIQGPIGPFNDNDLGQWSDCIKLDLLAPVALTQSVLRIMQDVNTPHSKTILFISGGGATAPRPAFSAYASAKVALVRFAETLSLELAQTTISVNCIAPGAMPTDMLADVVAAGPDNAGIKEFEAACAITATDKSVMEKAADLAVFLSTKGHAITGKLISAQWDRWQEWPDHLDALNRSDVYTLRRITGRDRGFEWGDV